MKRISASPTPLGAAGVQVTSDSLKRRSPPTLAKRVSAKLEEGNLKAAIRLMISEDSVSSPSAAVLASLQDKHPPSSSGSVVLPSPDASASFIVSEDMVKKAIMSFPAGSSGGPDGLSPQHLKVLLSCRVAGPDFLSALTGFTNMILAGRCPSSIAKTFFGGRLIALDKKAGASVRLL